jgi:hypothetical protein
MVSRLLLHSPAIMSDGQGICSANVSHADIRDSPSSAEQIPRAEAALGMTRSLDFQQARRGRMRHALLFLHTSCQQEHLFVNVLRIENRRDANAETFFRTLWKTSETNAG